MGGTLLYTISNLLMFLLLLMVGDDCCRGHAVQGMPFPGNEGVCERNRTFTVVSVFFFF